MPRPKKEKKREEGVAEWLQIYGDMVTLLLTFFVLMFTTATIDGYKLRIILSAFQGIGIMSGGNTLQEGKLVELGNTVESLPSMDTGRALDEAKRKAVSLFQPEVESEKVRITVDERGLVISLASDALFRPASAELDFNTARPMLRKVSTMLTSEQITEGDYRFRIEGHTDAMPTDPGGEWYSNWELSTARANNVLHALVDYGVNESNFEVVGYADTRPLMSNETEEGRAYNRRVDIVIMPYTKGETMERTF
ncbi:MAG: flagellar motor protein MotB [Spirochaetales bacterium]|nr:flagellar motor protein MotB [Spirochaetales bacterium]MCF7937606.1 flagellar motor protein MotB [Spirochaetales bacterium]